MAGSLFIGAGISSAVITVVELVCRNQRHPFGDRLNKALFWWLLLALLDAALAMAIVAGVAEADILALAPEAELPSWWQGVIIGAVGPLALRSPIRTKKIRNEDAPIGVTYVYDIARIYIFFAVDERMVRLRRSDVTDLRVRWITGGVIVADVAEYLRKHVEEHPQLSLEAKEEVSEAVGQCQTLPTEEQQMDGLIKLLRSRRFSAVRDHFTSQVA